MLSSLDPEYKFTDGPGYIIGQHLYVKAGETLPVYIPTLMTEIERDDEKKLEQVETSSASTIFINNVHPTLKGIVTVTNYVNASITDSLVASMSATTLTRDKSYKKKYERKAKIPNYGTLKYIDVVPSDVILEPGDGVKLTSEVGTFKDLLIDYNNA
jgi:hypothetical protein